jgi:hypothetical protein
MNDVDKLLAIEEIKKLKARYFRCLDTKDWVGFQSVFTPDIKLDSRQAFIAREPPTGRWVVNGTPVPDADALLGEMYMEGIETVRLGFESLRNVTSIHHGHMPEIEITSPTAAVGIWAMEDQLRWPEGGWPVAGPYTRMSGYGHYRETYEKGADNQWRIKTLTLTRMRIDMA